MLTSIVSVPTRILITDKCHGEPYGGMILYKALGAFRYWNVVGNFRDLPPFNIFLSHWVPFYAQVDVIVPLFLQTKSGCLCHLTIFKHFYQFEVFLSHFLLFLDPYFSKTLYHVWSIFSSHAGPLPYQNIGEVPPPPLGYKV